LLEKKEGNNKMELEKMMNDTQELSQRFHEEVGPWDRSLLVTHLAAVVGRLADDVMIIEGKLAMPRENARLARNIADAMIQLIRLGQGYQLDLERAVSDFLEEARQSLENEGLVTTMRNTLNQNQMGEKDHDNKQHA
jgi:hypothetical protein